MGKVCLYRYKDELVSDIRTAIYLASKDKELAEEISKLTKFEKQLLKENRLLKKNGIFSVIAKNGKRSNLFDSLVRISNNPMSDYEYVHSEIFIREFGNWKKAQEEWLRGEKTWIQAVRSNRINEALVDENLEPKVEALYPNYENISKNISTKKLKDLLNRAKVNIRLGLKKEKTDEEIIKDNFEEAKRLLEKDGDFEKIKDEILRERIDILETLREMDKNTRAYYDSKEKTIVYLLDEKELQEILRTFKMEKICL